MSKQITVTIGPTGKITMDAEGFTGSSCEEATQALQRVFNANTISDDKKPEYYQGGSHTDQNKLLF